MNNLLDIQNLQISFKNNNHVSTPVENVSLNIKKGRTVALVGESGSGKSLTAKSITGLLRSWNNRDHVTVNGHIFFTNKAHNRVDLNQLNDKELDEFRGKSIGFVFQEPSSALNPVVSVGKQIVEMLVSHKNISKQKAKERVIELLELVDLPNAKERYDYYPHQLSGGQLQRVMIAMAISCDPDLLIADEPTTALDVTVQKQILDLLKSLQKQLDMSILIITHDLALVSEFSDDVFVMYSGNIVENGETKKVFQNPKHPYTKLLLGSIITLETDLDQRLLVRKDFINEEGKNTDRILFYPENRSKNSKFSKVEENHEVSDIFTKVVEF